MGTGVNAQNRCVALIEADVPYRPCDTEQRHGRAIRQLNQNSEVELIRVVSERSFDVYMLQMLERKQGFVSQATSGKVAERELEDIDMPSLSFAEVKALASGNPLLMQKSAAEMDIAKYTRLKESYDSQQWRLRGIRRSSSAEIDRLTEESRLLDQCVYRRRETAGDSFRATVGHMDYSERKLAGEALITAARRDATNTLSTISKGRTSNLIGNIGGFNLRVDTGGAIGAGKAELVLAAPVPLPICSISLQDRDIDPVGVIRAAENRLRSFENLKAEITERTAHLKSQVVQAEHQLLVPWEHAVQYETALAKHAEIERLLHPSLTESALEPAVAETKDRQLRATGPVDDPLRQSPPAGQPAAKPCRAAGLSL